MEKQKARLRAAKQNGAKMRKSDMHAPDRDDILGGFVLFICLIIFLHFGV